MSWDKLEGKWKQQRGKALKQWGKIMNDELSAVAGRYDELVGKLQEDYGIAKEDAQRQVDMFKAQCITCRKDTMMNLKKCNGDISKMHKLLSKPMKAERRRTKLKDVAKR